jgi:hypothetical protein
MNVHRLLPALALIFTVSGCAVTDDASAADSAASSSPAATATASQAPKTGPWARYDLPEPASDQTGVTVNIAEPQVVGLGNLDQLSPVQGQRAIDAALHLLTISSMDLEQMPVRFRPNQFRAYLDRPANRDFNADLRGSDRTAVFGFEIPPADRDRLYDFKIRDLKLKVIQDYTLDKGPLAGRQAVHLRATWKMDYVMLAEKRNKPNPHHVVTPVVYELALAAQGEHGRPLLGWWKRVPTADRSKTTPVKPTR